MLLLLTLPLALADGATLDAPLLQPVDGGHIDWSTYTLVIELQSERMVGAWKDRRVQEQDALERIKALMEENALEVRLTPDRTARELLAGGDDVAKRLDEGLGHWQIDETRYAREGGVTMTATFDLEAWLRPAVLALAGAPPLSVTDGAYTGLVVDARGLPFQPCIVPRLSVAEGQTVFRAQALNGEVAQRQPPVQYVSDPADPRASRRAGEHPLVVRASAVQGGAELVLDPSDAAGLEMDPAIRALAANGRVVVVVDP